MTEPANGNTILPVGARRFVASAAEQAAGTGHPTLLDSSALIDHTAQTEPSYSLLAPLLESPAVPIVLSIVALAELVVRSARTGDRTLVAALHAELLRLPATRLVDFDQAHALETALIRAETNLRLPDSVIVATARLAGAGLLLGNDRRWRDRPLGVPYRLVADILALP